MERSMQSCGSPALKPPHIPLDNGSFLQASHRLAKLALRPSPPLRLPAFTTPQPRCEGANSPSWNGRPVLPTIPAQYWSGSMNSRPMQDVIFQQSRPETRLKIFSGTANLHLSQEIACYMGLELGKIKIKRFADGEVYVQLQESVRGCDVFLVQSTCPPANENLMELLVMIDACRRASAKNITAVIPYFGYARADRKVVAF